MHKANFGCSDLYFIFCLKPTTHQIKMCSTEISQCKWMPLQVSDFIVIQSCSAHLLVIVEFECLSTSNWKKYPGKKATTTILSNKITAFVAVSLNQR